MWITVRLWTSRTGAVRCHRRGLRSRCARQTSRSQQLAGQYVMQGLPPDTYTITFTRSGFATLRRQIDRISTYVATINACLQTGVVARSSD